MKQISVYPQQEAAYKVIQKLQAHQQEENARREKGLAIIAQLALLPFWCGNNTLHIERPNDYSKNCCCFNHVIGLPRHPNTMKPMPLTPFQVEIALKIIKDTSYRDKKKWPDEEEWKRLAHKYHLNKGRQMGITELMLRLILYFSFTRYAGRHVGMIALTNGDLAQENLDRLWELFAHIPQVALRAPAAGVIKLQNNTIIKIFNANTEGLTGHTKYACIFMDESAKWRLLSDTALMNSIYPIVNSNGSDLFMVSTPNGPVKSFYKIFKDPEDFTKLEYNIWATEGNLYTRKEIEKKLASSISDINQEYLCKFTVSENSVFGLLAEQNKGNFTEWPDITDGEVMPATNMENTAGRVANSIKYIQV